MRRLISTAYYKLCAMFGGVGMLPVVYLLLALCLAAAAMITKAQAPDTVTVALVNDCGGGYSRELSQRLGSTEGLHVVRFDEVKDAEDALLAGRAEALLVILPQYNELLTADGAVPLIELRSAPGAVSAELIREAAAGLLAAQRSEAMVTSELETEGYDALKMQQYIAEFSTPTLYHVKTAGSGLAHEGALFGSSYACFEGVAAFALLLLLLTLARRMADAPSRMTAHRMGAAAHGSALAFLSDAFALFSAGFIAAAIAFALAPNKSLSLALGLVCYDICISGLCLLTGCFGAAGRIDIAAPAIALITSLIGGCFADLASLSPALSFAAKCTPQGQLIACSQGNMLFAVLLLFEGLALCLLAAAVKNRKSAS